MLSYLTEPDPQLARLTKDTFPSMAHWAGTGPEGVTCRECIFWASAKGKYKRAPMDDTAEVGGELLPRRCKKYTRMMAGLNGHGVPHDAKACKYFELNDKPPRVEPGRAPKPEPAEA